MGRLSDFNLLAYEGSSAQAASADLSLWEEMAPVIRDTVMDVNALLTVIGALFPDDPGLLPEGKPRAVAERIGFGRDRLAAQVAKLGETLRSPAVMSDRWNLLSELQLFRSGFREQMGELVFETASVFAYVQRREVVPGFESDLSSAIEVRSAVADLRRELAVRHQTVEEAELEDISWNADQMAREMDAFGAGSAFQGLRAQDKRALSEHRQQLRMRIDRGHPTKADLKRWMEAYFVIAQSLAGNLNPELLKENDREVLAAAGVHLEQAQQYAETDGTLSARALAAAVDVGKGLYGRDEALDAFLRQVETVTISELQGPELNATVDVFRELLSNLSVHVT